MIFAAAVPVDRLTVEYSLTSWPGQVDSKNNADIELNSGPCRDWPIPRKLSFVS